MRRLEIKNYKVKTNMVDQNNKLVEQEVTYDIKTSIKSMLVINKSEGINFEELSKRMKIVEKLKTDKDYILLEEQEYKTVKDTFNSLKGLTENDFELGLRINNAEVVAVEIKPNKEDRPISI